MDEFERYLSKQPLRTVPLEWKTEILFAERKAGRGRMFTPFHGAASTNALAWWQQWLWPSPVAWAGLACVWLMIFALNFAARPSAREREMAGRTPSRSPQEIAVVLAQQRRELAQLLGLATAPSVAVRRPDPPGPRSEFICAIGEA
jgi:hypothetical protein